ncbi:MAG: CSLREA domain-containing protein [Thermomicrobiales bacterium]
MRHGTAMRPDGARTAGIEMQSLLRWCLTLGGAILLFVAVGLWHATAAAAATITVTTTADDLTPNDGGVSLREAITAINAGNSLGDSNITARVRGRSGRTIRSTSTFPVRACRRLARSRPYRRLTSR